MPDFLTGIRRMNEVQELELNSTPTDLGSERFYHFLDILSEEISEREDILQIEDHLDRLVALADWLADLIVYCCSEAARWGIPISLDSDWLEDEPTTDDPPPEMVDLFACVLAVYVAEARRATHLRIGALETLLSRAVDDCVGMAHSCSLPLEGILQAVLDSQDSKLVDGKPVKDERGKFLKGPNYVPPEPAIRALILKSWEEDQ